MPSLGRIFRAARSTSVAGFSFIHVGKYPTRRPWTDSLASKSRRLGTLETSPGSGPEISFRTSRASSTVRVMGPSLSSDQQRVMAPVHGLPAEPDIVQRQRTEAELRY